MNNKSQTQGWVDVLRNLDKEIIEEENLSVEQKLELAKKTLEDIINGCCNPKTAIRRVMLDLELIRKTLEKIK